MDAAGAARLQWRLEQQAHWRQAASVRDGTQPSVDPDGEQLERLEPELRIYTAYLRHGEVARACKRLVGGAWISGAYTEAADDQARGTRTAARQLTPAGSSG